jgi:hypothetical protein
MSASDTTKPLATDPAVIKRELTWWSTEPLGGFKSLASITGGPAAILAAFTVAAVVGLATQDQLETLDALSALCFAVSFVLLLNVLLVSVVASDVAVTPDERLSWFPEAASDPQVRKALRRRQLKDFTRFLYLQKRISSLLRYGIDAALAGMAFLLLARVDGDRVDLSRPEAPQEALLCAAALALFVAAILVASNTLIGVTGNEDEQAQHGASGTVDANKLSEELWEADTTPVAVAVANADALREHADLLTAIGELQTEIKRVREAVASVLAALERRAQ